MLEVGIVAQFGSRGLLVDRLSVCNVGPHQSFALLGQDLVDAGHRGTGEISLKKIKVINCLLLVYYYPKLKSIVFSSITYFHLKAIKKGAQF